MKKEKYLANIDKTLIKLMTKKSKSLADQNRILFSNELIEQGHIRKIAFDVYKVDNDPYQDLWVTQEIDGQVHLVRAETNRNERKESGDWSAVSDSQKQNVTLSYKNIPITRFSSTEYGFGSEDIMTFKSALLDVIENDNEFVKKILASQPESKRESLTASFPELKKIIKG